MQRRIQNFRVPTAKMGLPTNYLIHIFPKSALNWKKLDQEGGARPWHPRPHPVWIRQCHVKKTWRVFLALRRANSSLKDLFTRTLLLGSSPTPKIDLLRRTAVSFTEQRGHLEPQLLFCCFSSLLLWDRNIRTRNWVFIFLWIFSGVSPKIYGSIFTNNRPMNHFLQYKLTE